MEYVLLDDRDTGGFVKDGEIFVNLSSLKYDDQFGDDNAIRLLGLDIQAIEFHELGHVYNSDLSICSHDYVPDETDSFLEQFGFGINHCPWCSFTEDFMGSRIHNIGHFHFEADYSDKSKWEENDRVFNEFKKRREKIRDEKKKLVMARIREAYKNGSIS